MEVNIYYKKENLNFVETMDIDFVWNEEKQQFFKFENGTETNHNVFKIANAVIKKIFEIKQLNGLVKEITLENENINLCINLFHFFRIKCGDVSSIFNDGNHITCRFNF